MRTLIIALIALAAPLAAQNLVGVYGTPQVPANNVAQGRTDYTVMAFAAVQIAGSGSVSFTACTVNNIAANPATSTDTVRIRLFRDSYPFNLSVDATDTVLATVNNPTAAITFSGFNQTLPTLSTPNPWPFFIAIDVAGAGTSTVGRNYQLSLTAMTQTGIMTTTFPINGNNHTIVAPSNAEMDVQRSGTSIAAGAQDYVGMRQAGTAFVLTYTVLNSGSDPLNLPGSPRVEIISITVTNCTANVTVQPTTPVAVSGGSTTFQVTVTPATSGQQFGFGFIIPNSDNDENPYNIVVYGDAVVTAPTATQLVITQQPGNGTAGGVLSTQPIVEAQDGSGNLATGYIANITAAITTGTGTGGAALLGTVMIPAVGGVAQFTNLGIDLAGTNYTLTFTSGALTPDVSSSFNITGGGGSATQLVITTQPGNGTGGTALATQPVVEARTSGGALDSGFGGQVTAAISSGTGTAGATLVGTVTVTASGGVATFANLAIDLAGTGYTLTFSSGALTPDVSNTFNVTVGAVTQMVITTQPGGAAPGTAFTQQPVVELQDAGGNLVSSDNTTVVTAGILSGTGTAGSALSGTAGVMASAGTVTFTDLSIDLAGNGYQLEFTAAGLSPVNSNTFNVSTGGGGGGGGGGGEEGGCSTGAIQGWSLLVGALALLAVGIRTRKV